MTGYIIFIQCHVAKCIVFRFGILNLYNFYNYIQACSIPYLYHIPAQTIGKIIPETCQAIVSVLKDYMKVYKYMYTLYYVYNYYYVII